MPASAPRLPGRLAPLPLPLLDLPIDTLGLCTRAFRCVRRYGTVAGLLAAREDELMARRSFGRACLADVRRRLTQFALERLGAPDGHPMRVACCHEGPNVLEAWDAPPQPRPIADVVDEILELLARGEHLSANGRRGREKPAAGGIQGAGMAQMGEFVLAPLRPREREVLLLRFSAPDEEAPSLAELGRRFNLTRERIRQLTVAALGRLGRESERQRRHAVTEWLAGAFRAGGGVLREERVHAAMRRRFRGAPEQAYPLSRVLLETTPAFTRVRGDVWCDGAAPRAEVGAAMDALHDLIRKGQRPVTARQLCAACARHSLALLRSEPALQACLAAEVRLRELGSGRLGLREWQWGVPASLPDALLACIRTRARPQSVVRVVEHVNSVLPADRAVTQPEVLSVLGTLPAFVRVRTGVYGLAEWTR